MSTDSKALNGDLLIGFDRFPGRFLQSALAEAERPFLNLPDSPNDNLSTPTLFINCWEKKPEMKKIASRVEAERIVILASHDDLTDYSTHFGNAKTITIKSAPIVGTGMTGRIRRLADSIYRATYCQITDNEAEISVVHALDVATALLLAASGKLEGTITLGSAPRRVNDLADAIAKRMSDKRMIRLPLKKSRRWAMATDIFSLGFSEARKRLKENTTSLIITSSPDFEKINFKPRDVVDYLTTHQYTHDDL